MSPRQCLVTDKQEPRFHRKHGRVLPFGLTLEQGNKMSNTDEGKPAGKSGRRSRKGESKKGESKKTAAKKGPPESPAPVQLQSPDQDKQLQPQPVHTESPKVDEPPPVVDEPVVAVAAAPEPSPVAAPSPAEPAPAELATVEPATAEPVLAEPARAEPAKFEPAKSVPVTAEPATAAPAPAPVSLQTIANAYRDYTRKSFEDFGSFFEQLSGARSLEKAMSVHTEFVKRAYETSVAESQKICELHSKLARQTLEPLQGLVGKTRDTRRKL
jgi:hypothetical protein